MLPVVLLVSLFVVGSYGEPYPEPYPEPKGKVVEIPYPKAVVQQKDLRQDKPYDHHEEVPIKKTEVVRVVKKVPLIHEVPIFVHKNKPFLSPVAVPRKIQVHEVVGVPVVHDKHVIQPFYVDRPYIVEKQQFVPQPYPVFQPLPIDFVKKITKVFDRKVEVPHFVPVPLVKTVDRPVPVPYTKHVTRYHDVHVKVPRPVPVHLTKHVTHVEKVPFETPNVIVEKQPVHHDIKEFIPKVPQGFHGRVLAGTPEDQAATAEAERFGPHTPGRTISVRPGPGHGVIGPNEAPQPRHLATEFFDGRNGQPLGDGVHAHGGSVQAGQPTVHAGGVWEGDPVLVTRFVANDGGQGGFGQGGGGNFGFGGFDGNFGGADGGGGFFGFNQGGGQGHGPK